MTGDSTMNTAILSIPDAISAPQPAWATAAPIIPPTSACDDDVGSPSSHVMMSQAMAPMRPANTTPTVSASC